MNSNKIADCESKWNVPHVSEFLIASCHLIIRCKYKWRIDSLVACPIQITLRNI